MKKKQFIWWLLGAAVLILTAAASFYWDTLLMYAMPQIPLRRALDEAITALEERYQESPLPILIQGYDPDGLNTAQLELSQGGTVKGRLDVQMDLEQNRLAFQGTLPEASQLGSLSVYLDPDRIALTSDTLLQGGYYGITYDTFRQDLQQIPLVRFLVPDQMVSQWEKSFQDLSRKLSWNLSLPELPEIPLEELKSATVALWLLRSHVSVQELDVGGQIQPCWKVDYNLHEKIVGFIWEAVTGQPMPHGGRVQFTFYLYQDSLVRIEVSLEVGTQNVEALLCLGPNVKEDDLSLDVKFNGVSQNLSLRTQQGRRALALNSKTYAYDWDSSRGDLTLLLTDRDPLPMTLTAAENGFQIQSDRLWSIIQRNPASDYSCTVTVSKGRQLQPPEYKNLNEWSLDDLLIFTNGIWTLIQPQTN